MSADPRDLDGPDGLAALFALPVAEPLEDPDDGPEDLDVPAWMAADPGGPELLADRGGVAYHTGPRGKRGVDLMADPLPPIVDIMEADRELREAGGAEYDTEEQRAALAFDLAASRARRRALEAVPPLVDQLDAFAGSVTTRPGAVTETAPSQAIEDRTWPEPEDRGTAVLSDLGTTEYVEDLLRPGRIVVWAAEEGAGKSYTVDGELGIRVAVAGGALAGVWPIVERGPVLVLSEMHPDDDYVREASILDALDLDRAALTGRYYRLPLMTAAGGPPVLMVPAWREWVTGWLRDRGALLLIVDTATGATQVDPWGKAIQEVYRDLRAMLEAYPALAIVLVIHLKKPQGRGDRRISDVMGEWGRWNDVTVIQEADGTTRTKLATYKRIRHQRRIVATRANGLLVDPVDLDTATGTKVPPAKVVEAVTGAPGGLTYRELGELLGVSGDTAARYVKHAGESLTVVQGSRTAPARVYPGSAGAAGAAHAGAEPSAVGHEATGDGEVPQVPHAYISAAPAAAPLVAAEVDAVGAALDLFGDMLADPVASSRQIATGTGDAMVSRETEVPGDPSRLDATRSAPATPPCFADPSLFRGHQSKHYDVESGAPGCGACDSAEVPG